MTEHDDKTSWLPVMREGFAGLIAIVFATAFLLLIVSAYGKHADEKAFAAIKELITIVNGVVGVIVGYYFSRMTTEARAEKAETTAAKATDAAGKATEAASKAIETAKEANVAVETAKQAEHVLKARLTTLADSATEVMGMTTMPSTKSADGTKSAESASLARLRDAVRQAERALGSSPGIRDL